MPEYLTCLRKEMCNDPSAFLLPNFVDAAVERWKQLKMEQTVKKKRYAGGKLMASFLDVAARPEEHKKALSDIHATWPREEKAFLAFLQAHGV